MKFDFDGEQSRELFLELPDPPATLRIVHSRERIVTAEPGTSHAPSPDVIHGDHTGIDILVSRTARHRNTSDME
jgi:hypothetical protein